MNQVSALFKKEIMESVRNFKLFVLLAVFIIIGIISPLTTLLMPDIMAMVMEDAGISFDLPAVTGMDSYVQFFGNMNQLGLPILVVVTGSILTNEFTRNTLVNFLTKGLKRHNVIIVKFLYTALMWTFVYVLSAVTAYLYTMYYWDNQLENIWGAFALTWLYGVFLISVIMLASAIFRTSFLGVLFTLLGVVIIMIILSIHPASAEYLPQFLITSNVELLTGESGLSNVLPAVLITVAASVLILLLSIMTFNKATI